MWAARVWGSGGKGPGLAAGVREELRGEWGGWGERGGREGGRGLHELRGSAGVGSVMWWRRGGVSGLYAVAACCCAGRGMSVDGGRGDLVKAERLTREKGLCYRLHHELRK